MKWDDTLLDTLQQYLEDTLPEAARTDFEQRIANEPELQEFIEAFRQTEAFTTGDWPLAQDSKALSGALQEFRGAEAEAFEKQLKAAASRYHAPQTKPTFGRKGWLAIAGVAAVVAILFSVLSPGSITSMEAYEQYSSWEELPSLSVKSDTSEDALVTLERAFREGNYAKVVTLGTALQDQTTSVDPNLWLYTGVALLEMEQYDKALQNFQELIESNTLDAHKGYWYQALVYLRQGKVEEARTALKAVTAKPSHYRYAEAQKLLKKLE